MTRAYLTWAAVCVFWGTTYLAIRVALDTTIFSCGLRWTARCCWSDQSWGFGLRLRLEASADRDGRSAYINPPIAVLVGTVVLREPFSARSLVACAVVLAGTAIV